MNTHRQPAHEKHSCFFLDRFRGNPWLSAFGMEEPSSEIVGTQFSSARAHVAEYAQQVQLGKSGHGSVAQASLPFGHPTTLANFSGYCLVT